MNEPLILNSVETTLSRWPRVKPKEKKWRGDCWPLSSTKWRNPPIAILFGGAVQLRRARVFLSTRLELLVYWPSVSFVFHLRSALRLLARQVPLCVSFVYGSCAPCGSYTFNRHASVKTDGNLWQVSLTLSLSFFHSSSSWLVTDETRSGLFFFLLVDNIYLYFFIYIYIWFPAVDYSRSRCVFQKIFRAPFFCICVCFFFFFFLFGMMAIRIYKAASS